MEDLISYAVAIAVIYGAYRWLTSSKRPQPPPGPSLGFTPKRVTQEMVTQVQAMFPDQLYDNIQYDLLRTGSVQVTCNNIIEKGFLPAPPQAYFTLYPTQAPTSPAVVPRSTPTSAAQTSKAPSLIQRYNLEKAVESGESVSDVPSTTSWETTAEKREAKLRDRKAQMILAARQRLLAQEKGKAKADP